MFCMICRGKVYNFLAVFFAVWLSTLGWLVLNTAA